MSQRTLNETCALILLDVDNFKNINDTLGHNMGDKVLISIANILVEIFREQDIVSRFGGDEFLIFVKDFNDIDCLKRKCDKIDEQVKYILDGRFGITCSMGLCVLKSGQATMEKMFKVADDALYEVKTFKKGKYIIHEYKNKLREQLPLMVIVDDDAVDREVIAVQFEEEYRIEKFEDAQAALEFIEQNVRKISVILLDLIMPEISGIDLLKNIKSKLSTSKIFVVAIASDEIKKEYVLQCGADDIITKPIVPAIIKLIVKNVTQKR